MRTEHRVHTMIDDHTVALLGNPNVGKSTLFNLLTGGKQHTGNWAGKTVEVAHGCYRYKGKRYILTDLPGTYSLISASEEEKVALDHLKNVDHELVVIVADATCLERNIIFALQVMEYVDRVLFCINMMDEAERDGISVDLRALQREMGIPVVGISASNAEGIEELKETIRELADGFLSSHPLRLSCFSEGDAEGRVTTAGYSHKASQLMKLCVSGLHEKAIQRLDKLLLGRWTGRFFMLLTLMGIFWLTIFGANFPSQMLQNVLMFVGDWLRQLLSFLPELLCELLIDGIYLTTARVISVMLPPMLIFFILFSLLEDMGYLPRVAFLTDHAFEHCGSCGKQVLTMSMGFGCNAVGVAGCRIISSPKERLLAIITNSLVPCNGRFPALIALAFILFPDSPFFAALMLSGMILLSVVATIAATKLLGISVLKERDSHFIIEMPPYRRPSLRKILVAAIKDRTVFVLGRAAMIAAPAGAFIWMANKISVGGETILMVWSRYLDPIGEALGMNGLIVLAFILSFPANELLLPLIVMMLNGNMPPDVEIAAFGQIFSAASWSKTTALCMMVFVLFHWPCSATCLTIHKETKSWMWTCASLLLPTLIGATVCIMINVCLN